MRKLLMMADPDEDLAPVVLLEQWKVVGQQCQCLLCSR
jgi:hypothetical protein